MPASVKGLLGPKKSLFSFKGKSSSAPLASEEILCINLSEQEAGLAVLTSKITGEKQVDQFRVVDLKELSFEDGLSRIETVVDEMHLKSPRLVATIPASLAVTRNIEIPSRDPKEIREILSLQATRHTPYSRDEIIIDHIDLGAFKDVYTKVLFIIVPRKVVMKYSSLATRLQIPLEKIVFSPEAIAHACWKHLNILGEKPPLSVVHVGAVSSEFMVMDRGEVLFVRSIPVGARHFEAAREGYQARFIAELQKSLEAYKSENISDPPSKVFLGGALNGLGDLSDDVQEALNISTKLFADAQVLSLNTELKDKVAAENRPLLATAASGMLSREVTVDLSPEENKMKRSLEERSKQVIKAGILGMILLGLLCLWIGSHVFFRTAQLQQLNEKFEPIKKETVALEATYERVRTIKSHLAMKGKALETLVEISSLISEDLFLSEVKYEAEKRMGIKGSSYVKASIFNLVDAMESSELFKNVQTKYITGRIQDGVDVSDFEIVAMPE